MSGVITSPYYPRNYPNNQNCLWEITASKGNRVKLEVTDMEIHRCGGDACTCDYLEILDGYLVLNTQIGGAASGKVCIDGKFTPQTYYSMNEHLRVRFFSNPPASKNSRGFTATYTQLNYSPPGMYTLACLMYTQAKHEQCKYLNFFFNQALRFICSSCLS